MAFDTGISSAIAQYVFTQTEGAVTEPIGGSYIQAYCEFLGIAAPLHNSWLIALCNHFGITAPVNASWTIALANFYGITSPTGGTFWMALAFAAPPVTTFIWDENTVLWNLESRVWNIGTPVVPTASFDSNVTTITVGDFVQFFDTSTGVPTSFNWTFQSGTPSTSTLQDPLIQFNTVGQFTVSLQATNALGSNTVTVPDYLTVNVVPVVANFDADTVTPVEGDSVQFTDISTGDPTNFLWSITGATPDTSVLQNPLVVYNTAGTYTVALTASKTGSTDTETKVNFITVAPPFGPFINYNINNFDNGLLGMSSSQYNDLDFYNDLTYIKIND